MAGDRVGVSLRLLLPMLCGGAAAAGAICGYLLDGPPLYAVAGAALGASGAGLVASASIASSATHLAGALGQIAGRRPPGTGDAPRFEELAALTDSISATASAFTNMDESASQDRTRLLAALNSTADAVIGLDREANVTFANVAAERFLIRSRDELIGRPFVWVMPNAEVNDLLQASREQGRRQVRVIERPNRHYLQVSASPILGGGDWSVLVVFNDVTDVKLAERMRRDFVANVSHELRTPLASIKAVLETLEAGAISDRTTALDFISRAHMEVDRLTELVGELMELSRIEAGDLPVASEPIDLEGVIREVVSRLQPQADRLGVALAAQVGAGLAGVVGDSVRVERALVNLVQNALKFTPAGGSVSLSAREADDSVSIEVTDTGQGIDEGDLGRVFERFYKADNSRRTDGSGLGLALVKHTAESHGGSVSVRSRLGEGSTFTMILPASPREPATAGREASRTRRPG